VHLVVACGAELINEAGWNVIASPLFCASSSARPGAEAWGDAVANNANRDKDAKVWRELTLTALTSATDEDGDGTPNVPLGLPVVRAVVRAVTASETAASGGGDISLTVAGLFCREGDNSADGASLALALSARVAGLFPLTPSTVAHPASWATLFGPGFSPKQSGHGGSGADTLGALLAVGRGDDAMFM
jgi:hypothetical protein